MPHAHDDALASVGPRLRFARSARGMTLRDVSTATGISTSTLSRLESGGRRPTLELLLSLARAYAVPIDELVGAPEVGDPRVHVRPVADGRGGVMLPLSRGASGIRVFKHVLPRAPREEAPRQRSHAGNEWLYVISGRVRLLLGEREFVLGAGEAAEFDTRLPHWFGAEDGPAECLSLFGPEGQRVHVAEA